MQKDKTAVGTKSNTQPSFCFLWGGVDGTNGENRENREDRINGTNETNEINEINGTNEINGKLPIKRSAPIYPIKRSAPIYPIKRSAPIYPIKRSAPIYPIKRSVTHLSHQAQRPHLSHQAQRYPFIPAPIHLIQRTISCQKGLDLAYRKSECPRIVQIVQPRVINFLRCAADDSLSQEIQ